MVFRPLLLHYPVQLSCTDVSWVCWAFGEEECQILANSSSMCQRGGNIWPLQKGSQSLTSPHVCMHVCGTETQLLHWLNTSKWVSVSRPPQSPPQHWGGWVFFVPFSGVATGYSLVLLPLSGSSLCWDRNSQSHEVGEILIIEHSGGISVCSLLSVLWMKAPAELRDKTFHGGNLRHSPLIIGWEFQLQVLSIRVWTHRSAIKCWCNSFKSFYF